MTCNQQALKTAFSICAAAACILNCCNPTSAAQAPQNKRVVPAKTAAGPNAVSQDFGDVALLVDNGLMVTAQNKFNLNGTTIRFEPAGTGKYTVSHFPSTLEPVFGPALTFGYAGAVLYPGDDDTQQVAFPAGFPFFGTTYTSAWVNTDGNVTFGASEFASDDRDKAKHVSGPPRISGYLMDVNAKNAYNPSGSGSIHAVAKSNPDRLVVTWNGVADFEGGVSSTFQIVVYASGVAEITLSNIDSGAKNGVTGIAQGGGNGPIQIVDLLSAKQTYSAGAILEAFSEFTQVNAQQVSKEFYKTHGDKYDYLIQMTDFSADFLIRHYQISNQTHGIGTPLTNGSPDFPTTVYDRTAEYGSAGNLEQVMFLNNINLWPTSNDGLINPAVEPYIPNSNVVVVPKYFGSPITLDNQTMTQDRITGTLVPDGGEITRNFARGGQFSIFLSSAMSTLIHEVLHRYGAYVKFVHPIKGIGFDSFDLLGIDTQHWSYFFNTAVPSSQFPGAPRSSANLGNNITDLGPITSYNGVPIALQPGESVFVTAPNELVDGYSELDQYLMGIRRANEVSPFFYVDEPRSIFTGQSLDPFNPADPLDRSVTMRAWLPQSGIVFAGKRVDLTLKNIMDYEKIREKGDNSQGKRFWGPKGNLKVRYFSNTGKVDPNGDASVTLSEADRELGDEADMIDTNGKPVDIKTMAFILVVQSGAPASHSNAVNLIDSFRQAWEAYGNGPATGGRGKFDTRLNPPVY